MQIKISLGKHGVHVCELCVSRCRNATSIIVIANVRQLLSKSACIDGDQNLNRKNCALEEAVLNVSLPPISFAQPSQGGYELTRGRDAMASLSDGHSSKAFVPIEVTEFGISIAMSALQPSKAALPIDVTEVGIVIEVSAVQQ
jgi:hypothetical protein